MAHTLESGQDWGGVIIDSYIAVTGSMNFPNPEKFGRSTINLLAVHGARNCRFGGKLFPITAFPSNLWKTPVAQFVFWEVLGLFKQNFVALYDQRYLRAIPLCRVPT